jgi:glucan phosphoethanolaminetransferase (alkaline phosphatase superfamily)
MDRNGDSSVSIVTILVFLKLVICFMLVSLFILRRWRRHVPPKLLFIFKGLLSVTSLKIQLLISFLVTFKFPIPTNSKELGLP